MELISIEKVKKLAIIALVSNDYLMDTLVLKGGNAIELVSKGSGRASLDLDFSIPGDFEPASFGEIRENVIRSLNDTFHEEGFPVFDVQFIKNPPVEYDLKLAFWGGYRIEFKIIHNDVYEKKKDNVKFLRKNAAVTGLNTKKTFNIDISKYEYCREKVPIDVDGYTVYVYSEEMLIIEKIRAICQQNPRYREIVHSHKSGGRAKDFFDICFLNNRCHIDFTRDRVIEIIRAVFDAKKVPLAFLKDVSSQKELHAADFDSLKDTVVGNIELKDFDYYFQYVISILDVIIPEIL
jgi:predicted nucleotidyltransferase component of viral defense system